MVAGVLAATYILLLGSEARGAKGPKCIKRIPGVAQCHCSSDSGSSSCKPQASAVAQCHRRGPMPPQLSALLGAMPHSRELNALLGPMPHEYYAAPKRSSSAVLLAELVASMLLRMNSLRNAALKRSSSELPEWPLV